MPFFYHRVVQPRLLQHQGSCLRHQVVRAGLRLLMHHLPGWARLAPGWSRSLTFSFVFVIHDHEPHLYQFHPPTCLWPDDAMPASRSCRWRSIEPGPVCTEKWSRARDRSLKFQGSRADSPLSHNSTWPEWNKRHRRSTWAISMTPKDRTSGCTLGRNMGNLTATEMNPPLQLIISVTFYNYYYC